MPMRITAAQTKDAAPSKVPRPARPIGSGCACLPLMLLTSVQDQPRLFKASVGAVLQVDGERTKAFPSQPSAGFQCKQLIL